MINELGYYLIEAKQLGDGKLLNVMERLRKKVEKFEDKHGMFGYCVDKNKLDDYRQEAIFRGLI